jgi:hypothetical protein
MPKDMKLVIGSIAIIWLSMAGYSKFGWSIFSLTALLGVGILLIILAKNAFNSANRLIPKFGKTKKADPVRKPINRKEWIGWEKDWIRSNGRSQFSDEPKYKTNSFDSNDPLGPLDPLDSSDPYGPVNAVSYDVIYRH